MNPDARPSMNPPFPAETRSPSQSSLAQSAKRPELRASDSALVELLRKNGKTGVGELASTLRVTATAVRQRLERLMREGIVAREVVVNSVDGGSSGARRRGRPAHVYGLTEKGERTGGDNFRDLAVVLWSEIRRVESPEVRRGLLSRVGSAMAELYGEQVADGTLNERLDQVVGLFRERQITCGVEYSTEPDGSQLAILTSHVCPYPEIAEIDRGICASERLMLQDLLGARVSLATCRLDGADCCRFAIPVGAEAGRAEDGEAGGEP
jgi:DeoR family transcriptional regulator, suf operon transcriptional repressor